jgi:hypothetical protein
LKKQFLIGNFMLGILVAWLGIQSLLANPILALGDWTAGISFLGTGIAIMVLTLTRG